MPVSTPLGTPSWASTSATVVSAPGKLHKHETGDTAIDEGYFVGTNTGPMTEPNGESIPATGKRVRVRECDVATVENGVITSHRFYFDVHDWLMRLGLAPESAP